MYQVIFTLWWLFFWTACGLCLGSFLNVVIYRIPRGKSLTDPLWSACPNCHTKITWYDNLPIIGYLRLGGKCRSCNIPISSRYITIEVISALIVLFLFDAFFVGQVRAGVGDSYQMLHDNILTNLPIFFSHIILFICLLSMSVIDIEHYWVDIRFTNLATIVGFIAHIIWTPTTSSDWNRPEPETGAACIVAIVVLLISMFVLRLYYRNKEESEKDESNSPEQELLVDQLNKTTDPGSTVIPTQSVTEIEKQQTGELADDDHSSAEEILADGIRDIEKNDKTESSGKKSSTKAGWLMVAVLFVSIALLFTERHSEIAISYIYRMSIPIAVCFFLVVRESLVHRESDDEIAQAIEDESQSARKMAFWELSTLLPTIIAGGVVYFVISDATDSNWFMNLHDHKIQLAKTDAYKAWQPLLGLSTAATGFIVGGALGWFVRISFTLLLGKEAFGEGDIHLMAAAGCVAGWPVAVLGFFLSMGLALLGWLFTLPGKKPKAVPLGPWLSIGFFIVVVFYDEITQSSIITQLVRSFEFLITGNSQL